MIGAIFTVPGCWEFGLFKVDLLANPTEVKGSVRIPIKEAWAVIGHGDYWQTTHLKWYWTTPGGRWGGQKRGVYRTFAMRDGEAVIQVAPDVVNRRRGDTITIEPKVWNLDTLRKER